MISQPVKQAMADVQDAADSHDMYLFDSQLPDMNIFKKAVMNNKPIHQVRGRGSKGRTDAVLAVECIVDEILDAIEDDVNEEA